MVKHIILWKLKEEYSVDEKKQILKSMKDELEALSGKVSEIVEISVQIEKLESSNADAMLYSVFNSPEDLKAYAVHPDHQNVANTFVRPFVAERSCIDFEF